MIGSASTRRKATSASTRWVRVDTLPMVEFQFDGNSTADPARILASKRQFWSDFWGPETNADSNLRALQSPQQAAQEEEEPLPTITLSVLDTAPRASRRRACKGQDMLGPAGALALPDQGRQELTNILNQIEQAGTWPWQLLGSSFMLKPKPDNTNRPLGLLSMVVRIWEKIRQRPMQARCRERAGPWDQAVERSPALRLCHGRGSFRARDGRSPHHDRPREVLRHDTH